MKKIMSKIGAGLLAENKSLAVLVLLAVLGWSSTRLADQITSGQALVYATDSALESAPAPRSRITITLENISRDSTIRNLDVFVDPGQGYLTSATDVRCDIEAPNYIPEGGADEVTQCGIASENNPKPKYKVISILPGSRVRLIAVLNKVLPDDGNITVRLRSENSKDFRPMEKDWMTQTIKYEKSWLFCLSILAFILLLFAAFKSSTRE